MKKFALFAAFVLAGCFSDVPEDHGIIVPGCDAPESDPNRVCDGTGGGGGSSGGGGGGGSGSNTSPCGGICPYGEVCYTRNNHSYCAPRRGTRCSVGQEPAGYRCYTNEDGFCACYVYPPEPNTLTSEYDAVDAGQ